MVCWLRNNYFSLQQCVVAAYLCSTRACKGWYRWGGCSSSYDCGPVAWPGSSRAAWALHLH
jgi:hypothetical protein